MSEIAVWTDSDGKVQKKHYFPDTVDTSDAYLVQSEGTPPDVGVWVTVQEYYNPTDGFTYQTTDPLDNSPLSTTQKQELYKAFTSNDIQKARIVVENALSK